MLIALIALIAISPSANGTQLGSYKLNGGISNVPYSYSNPSAYSNVEYDGFIVEEAT